MKKILLALSLLLTFAPAKKLFAQEALPCDGSFYSDIHPLELRPGETYEKVFDMRGCALCLYWVGIEYPELKGKPKFSTEIIVDGKPTLQYPQLTNMKKETIVTYRFKLPSSAKPVSTSFRARYAGQTCQ